MECRICEVPEAQRGLGRVQMSTLNDALAIPFFYIFGAHNLGHSPVVSITNTQYLAQGYSAREIAL